MDLDKATCANCGSDFLEYRSVSVPSEKKFVTVDYRCGSCGSLGVLISSLDGTLTATNKKPTLVCCVCSSDKLKLIEIRSSSIAVSRKYRCQDTNCNAVTEYAE